MTATESHAAAIGKDTDLCPASAGAADALAQLLAIRVRTDAAQIAALQRVACGSWAGEQGATASEPSVPLTYPFCWLTLPEVRSTLERMIGGGFLPMHEAQSFHYARPLALDADYRVAFTFERKTGPDRLIVSAAISTQKSEPCATFETVLRLLPLDRLQPRDNA